MFDENTNKPYIISSRLLSRAEAEIQADLARLTRAHMADYVTRFVAALDAGAIEPADFNT